MRVPLLVLLFMSALLIPPGAAGEEADLVRQVGLEHPDGWVILVVKSSHHLYLLRNGTVVPDETALKSELDKRLFGFLEGTADDEMQVTFPFPVALSVVDLKPRRIVSDKRTPEGEYVVCEKNDRAGTGYTVALELAYPNLADATRGLADGTISKSDFKRIKKRLRRGRCPPYNTRLGGEIKIHGPPDDTLRELRKDKEAFRVEMTENTPFSGTTTDYDWTWGCVALEPSAMFYLHRVVPVGTVVVIRP